MEKATFAGGCFWCMEPAFSNKEGVMEVVSGYSGGKEENPSYEEVSSGSTGHLEAVQVIFNPEKVSYKEIINIYWQSIDPTDEGGQFADRGPQYKTAIFYHDKKQKEIAEKSKKNLEDSKKFDLPIATKIICFKNFYKAEEYHQNYYKKNQTHYKMYKVGSGREAFLNKTWK
ncbi:MAG: peptide-methionine (S)-S-oxide reductase MsrA [Candidatus Pacearchaeota archaeon]